MNKSENKNFDNERPNIFLDENIFKKILKRNYYPSLFYLEAMECVFDKNNYLFLDFYDYVLLPSPIFSTT